MSASRAAIPLLALTLAATAQADPRPTQPAQGYFATEYEGAHWLHKRAHRGTGPVFIATGALAVNYANLPGVPLPVPVPVPVPAVLPVPMPLPVPVVRVAVPVVPVAPVVRRAEPDLRRMGGGLMMQAASTQGAAALYTFAESKRWGVNFNYIGRFDDWKKETWHGPRLLDAHLTFSPFSGQRGRVRLEGGVAFVQLPDTVFAGPDLGFSAELRVLWIFGVGISGHLTPFPFFREELKQTVFANLGPVRLEGGYRYVKADVEDQQTCIEGPYAGASIIF